MVNVRRSGRQLKDNDDNSKKHSGTKGPSVSGSPNSDSSLRRSSREIPSKKLKVSLSTRKSERIEKRTPPTPPVKKKLVGIEKQRMPSPLRKSDKSENHLPSSSSSSRSSEKGLNLPDSKTKKEGHDMKDKATDSIDSNKGGENDKRPVRVVVGKKRLDARSYRQSLLTPLAKKTKESENKEKPKDHSVTSQRDGEASSSKEDDAAEGSATKSSSSDFIKLQAGKCKNSGEMELSHYRRKRKIHSDEIHESNHGDTSTVFKYSDHNLQPSPKTKEVIADPEDAQVEPVVMDNLLKVSSGTAKNGKSISSDECTEKEYTSDSTKRKRKPEELDCDASVIGASEEIHPSADPVTLSPSESKRGSILERCDACSKRQRFDVDSQKYNMCSCSYAANQDSCNNPSTEEVQEKETVPTLENNEMPMCPAINDGNAINVNAIDNNNEEPAHGSESLSINQRNNEHDQTGENTFVWFNSLKEDECGKVVLKESERLQENDDNACVVCKLGGKLVCCDGIGCQRNYHVDCLEPSIKVAPFGVWHCPQCVAKKIQFGVHSVSEGVESIWDVREEKAQDSQGMEKHYLVKYKGLAHVHNRWIPEHQLRREAPSLIAKFEKTQVLKWKLDWTRPQHLLRKREIISQNCQTEDSSDCRFEWYVKWCGLGYEHASWELENAPFLNLPEARALISDYEARLEKAVLASNPSRAKILENRKLSSLKLSELPCNNVAGPTNDYLSFVNKLREYWRKNQNAVFVEDQERIVKVILFILSIQSDVCRPFLIISTPSTVSVWEAEFLRYASSMTAVVYDGTKDIRESIRALEFYEDSGCVMLQVLLAPIDAVIEDVEALELIGWEAIIFDEYQCSTVSRNFEQIKKLTSGFRILLPSSPIKEDVSEYLNLLSFIESGGDRIGDVNMRADPSCIISKLKERFSRYVACEKSDATKFVEYWVPVHLSNVQLEQYCATLLSNSIPLCSYSKNDPTGVLRDTLISVKKCCNHPYLVDQSLQSLLTKDLPEVEYLDIGVKASGKLQFLDKILLEIKKKGLRVLIVFQAKCGSGKINVGDILDDFLRQRFGPDTYERIDSLLVSSKKQAALKTFNKKERGRFVFLIENRACSQSIKLSSIDMVILFDSDWNPSNDLRALQKITIDSQLEQIKVIRLYSPYTVEEKVLSLAKQDMALDSNLQNWNSGTSHALLLWGAKLLFQKLEEFHNDHKQTHGSSVSSEQSFLNDLVLEFLNLLPDKAETPDIKKFEIILKAHQSGASYSTGLILPGEKEEEGEELPHLVWTNLLDGKYPPWRYSSGMFQRSRRKVQNSDQVPKKTQENDETGKKRKKVANINVDLNTLNSRLDDKRKSVSMDRGGTSGAQTFNGSQNLMASAANKISASHPVKDQHEVHIGESNERKSFHDSQEYPHPSLKSTAMKLASMDKKGSVNDPVLNQGETQIVESNEGINLHDSQQNLHVSLKSAILKLCEIIEIPEEVKSMAGKFLEYILNNHNITTEPLSIFQAFQISLCWSAASLLKYKISHKKSLSLAKEHLHFQCNEEETNLIYSKLRMLKKMFSGKRTSVAPISAETSRDEEKYKLHIKSSQSKLSSQKDLEEGEISESPKNLKCPVQLDSSTQNQAPAPENASGSSKTGSSKGIKKVNKTYSRRIRKLYQKQIEELEKFNKNKEKIMEKEKADLIVNHKLESALICSLHNQSSVRSDKLKMVDQELIRKTEELNVRMEMQLKNLEDMQRKARSEEAQLKDHWLQEAQSGRSVANYATLPLSDSGFREEHMVQFQFGRSGLNYGADRIDDCERSGVGHEKAFFNDANEVPSTLPSNAIPSELGATNPDDASENLAIEPASLAVAMGERGIEHSALLSKSAPDTVQGQQKGLCLSDSSSVSLEQSLIDSPTDPHASTREGEFPSFQVPVGGHAQTDTPVDPLLSVHSNEDAPVRPPALHLPESSFTYLESNEQSRPIAGCPSVDQEQMNDSVRQSEAAASEQDVIDGQSGSLNRNQYTQAISEHTLVTAPSADPHSIEHCPHSIEHCQPDICTSMDAVLACDQVSLAATQQTEDPAPVAALRSTEQCQPDGAIGTCVPLHDIQFSVAASQETEIPAPVVNPPSSEQCQLEVATSRCASLPDNQFSLAVSQQTEVPAPVINPPSGEQCQLEVATSHCSSVPDNHFSQSASQQSEVPASAVNLFSTEQCQAEVARSLCASVPDNQFNQLASQLAEVPAPATNAPSSEQWQIEVPTRISASLPDNQYCQDASIQNDVPALAANLLSTERCQLEVAPSTCADHEARNEHNASTATRLTQVPSQSLAMEQTELVIPTCSQTNSQLRHLPESTLNASGSRLSDHRSMSSIQEFSLRSPQVPPASRISQQLGFNPLQHELLRIRREEEQVSKMHEDEKMRLNSEFEKEMEEIRRKYSTKILEVEAEFVPKKKVLKTNFSLACMNQILMEVFRDKLNTDATIPGVHGAKQGAASGSMQQVLRSPSVQVAQRPPVPGPSAATTMTPPVQAVHQPSALFSSTPVRTPVGQGLTPARIQQILPEIRAPAPHLQSFRPMVSLPATTSSPQASALPGQQSSGNLASTSIPPPQTSPNIVPFSRAHHPGNAGRLPGTHSSSSLPQSLLQPLHNIGQIIDTYDTAVRSSAATDVVCLSDDD